MEKIISEFRVIETDDGFRVEIKGDKEKIRALIHGFGKHGHGFGRHRPGKHAHGFGRHGPRPHPRAHPQAGMCGPFGFPFDPGMWMKAASCCGEWDFDEEEEEEEGAEA